MSKVCLQQTCGYFWDFDHPVSGMALERSTSGNKVTTGRTGLGVIGMIAHYRPGPDYHHDREL